MAGIAMIRGLFADDGDEDGIAHRGLPWMRNSPAHVAVDAGLQQDKAIGDASRASLAPHPTQSPNTGLRGTYVRRFNGYSVSPQLWPAAREAHDIPPANRSFPYLPGKNPLVATDDQAP